MYYISFSFSFSFFKVITFEMEIFVEKIFRCHRASVVAKFKSIERT